MTVRDGFSDVDPWGEGERTASGCPLRIWLMSRCWSIWAASEDPLVAPRKNDASPNATANGRYRRSHFMCIFPTASRGMRYGMSRADATQDVPWSSEESSRRFGTGSSRGDERFLVDHGIIRLPGGGLRSRT